MNKIAKRLVAGVSAAALLVSAVGVDQLADLFVRTSYADAEEGRGKAAKSTGFNNLEQDTDSDGKYNTGYGLHTNKTATEVKNADGTTDGRTFDVNLESWYVGENPVDVATILDASGSMAWTVDTLKPLSVSAQLTEDDKSYLNENYGTDSLEKIQEDNEGYLPQEVVDLILDKTNTDNTKLSYAGYKYYVYENRSSVSEFVPLGYWDGGEHTETFKPIGYYPFNGTLTNSMGGTAKYIQQAEESESFDESSSPIIKANGVFKNDALDLKATAKDSAILLDVHPKSNRFKIEFEVKVAETGDNWKGDNNSFDETPIMYIGSGDDTSNYYRIVRGSRRPNKDNGKAGAAAKFRVYDSTTIQPTTDGSNNAENDDKSLIDAALFSVSDKFYKCILNFDVDSLTFSADGFAAGAKDKTSCTLSALDYTKGVNLIIGGNPCEGKTNYSDVYVKNVKVYDDTGALIGNYSLDNDLSNKASSGSSATVIEQANGLTFDTHPIADTPATVKYADGNSTLNLVETAKNGAILLDAMPNSNNYTLSFKMKIKKGSADPTENQNIIYVGDGSQDTNKYQRIYRRNGSSSSHIGILDYNKLRLSQYLNGDKSYNNEWATITVTVDGKTAKVYVDGKQEYKSELGEQKNNNGDTYNSLCKWNTDSLSKLSVDPLKIILAGLWDADNYKNAGEIYLDDVYVFNETLDAGQVAAVANAKEGQTEFAILPSALTDGCKGYHATTEIDDKEVDIAQIKDTLAQNPNDEERRGWYYVNSHSKWEDIEGCLASGKQYIGIYDKDKDNGIDHVDGAGIDKATIPSAYENTTNAEYKAIKESIEAGDNDVKKFNKAPENERSIRFYVDSQNHLRCFAWSGSTSKDGDIRTFCSLVYEKGYNDDDNSEQITKYEELNNALNTFYQKIAEKSDLSNNAIVRFSTNSAIGDNETATNTNLKKLIMRDWTNWSDYYQKYKEDNSGSEPKTKDYLQNLLIPEDDDEKSTDITTSTHGIDEYPYVMTGGTYTWTGLKAFYDNMVKNEDSQTAQDIANDARDKYLIIFTDGRDNTQDYNVSEEDADTPAGSPVYDGLTKDNSTFGKENYVNKYNPYAGEDHKVGFSFEYYDYKDDVNDALVPQFKKGVRDITKDGDLAQAWADKLKDEGYTIYCVMMASGSISPTANADEYNKAKNFLKSLSGSNELDAQIAQMQQDIENRISDGLKPDGAAEEQTAIEALRDKYVIVVDPTVTGGMTVTEAFEQILEQIQLPRNDYTVQDYIDPRFDLIGKAYVDDAETEVIYHLGANGEVTFTDTNNKKLEEIEVKVSEDTKVTLKSRTKVGNIIDNITNTGITSLPYTPIESYMVNRKADSSYDDGYDTGNIGTGYIYYDNVKDMYYLRWTDQIIPMKNKSFDTKEGETDTYLDVWSATIRLKAKEDFIGGNNILTNGNEAGENLVYSDATIENMTDNPELYGLTAGSTYREKLAVLSGTDRKINAVDAGGVSQAVYGNGIDIPSSGFPRTTVNVRLLPLNANNLNDVIYMGEVVSPTMMLADLENGYMTGSYYLQYLERYAYRVYGEDADSMPLIELLNKWLKIDDKKEASKTFTIPYIYLPDPEYNTDGTLATADGKVKLENSTGWDFDKQGDDPNFADLNLRDVTGFITYTWKRDDGGEEQQKTDEDSEGKPIYDVTLDYVVKNTKQIKYNLQLTFTPLKEEDLPSGFTLDTNFIIPKDGDDKGDQFFAIDKIGASPTYEFIDKDGEGKDISAWSISFNRADYLKAMIKEKHTYTPHIEYDTTKQKWQLLSGRDEETKDVYDWDKDYKKVVGNAQLEGDLKLYTSTTDNVNFADADGVKIEGTTATAAPVSLAANTTYTKDVVNAALALELFVDGKYLNNTDSKIKKGNTFTFEATRYYDDPIDPLPYDTTGKSIGANTGVDGKKYKLTFKVTDIPTDVKENEISKVWAKLTEVKVEASTAPDDYKLITDDGYTDVDALPIGTYVISVTNDEMGTADSQYDLGKAVGDISNAHFKYLKVDTDSNSYEHSKFPENVYQVSESAADSTEDGEYQIWNNTTDYSKKNIAESNRTKDTDAQTATFYFGTVKDGSGDKGVSVKDYLKENPEAASAAEFKNDYAKDRLGIIMLSADNNSLAITKEITNYKDPSEESREWTFTVTIKTDDTEWINDHGSSGIMYDLYTRGSTSEDWTKKPDNLTATFTDSTEETTHTLTVEIKLTHNQKVILKDLPDGDWQVTEAADVFCTPHNNANGLGEDEWRYQSSAKTGVNTLTPISQVDYINEFPYELPSAGGSGTLRFVLFGTLLTAVGAMLFAVLYYDRRKRARK